MGFRRRPCTIRFHDIAMAHPELFGVEPSPANPSRIYREFARILQTDAAHSRESRTARGYWKVPPPLKLPSAERISITLLGAFPRGAAGAGPAPSLRRCCAAPVSLAANQDGVAVRHLRHRRDRGALAAQDRPAGEERMARALAGWRGPVARLSLRCHQYRLGRRDPAVLCRPLRADAIPLRHLGALRRMMAPPARTATTMPTPAKLARFASAD